jgi:hypothetical protein
MMPPEGTESGKSSMNDFLLLHILVFEGAYKNIHRVFLETKFIVTAQLCNKNDIFMNKNKRMCPCRRRRRGHIVDVLVNRDIINI